MPSIANGPVISLRYERRLVKAAGLARRVEHIAEAAADFGQGLGCRPRAGSPAPSAGSAGGCRRCRADGRHARGSSPPHRAACTRASINCSRRSGDVSIRIATCADFDQQRRRGGGGCAGRSGSHSPQFGPIAGTPVDAPQPRIVTFIGRELRTGRRPRLGEQAKEIGGGRRCQRLRLDPFQRCHRRRRRRDKSRLVALAAIRHRREIGAVGLDQQAVERQVAHDRAQTPRRS